MGTVKPFLKLDASIMDSKEVHDTVRLDVELNRIVFEFPDGFAEIPLLEECRALNNLEDFDFMYDITMQLLTEKPVLIYLRDYENRKHEYAKFICVGRHMDLRSVDVINSSPIIVNWLVGFVAEHLRKKYPRPLSLTVPPAATLEKKPKAAKDRK